MACGPRVAIGPDMANYALEGVRGGGGTPVGAGESADALVWLALDDVAGLRAVLAATPGIRWVQLPFAGVENYSARSVFTGDRVWTCAKGVSARPVAEHALALALAGLRRLPERIGASSWGPPGGVSLYDQRVTILGGGGVARALISLLAPFRVQITVVRRQRGPVPGAQRVLLTERIHQALPGALVVFVAAALTPQTTGMVSRDELSLMGGQAWLVNVARGRHVDTAALTAALARGFIGGAALDVTDPEPLPAGHPLWHLSNCIITPHTADTPEMTALLLTRLIAANVAHFVVGEPLEGRIDCGAGY